MTTWFNNNWLKLVAIAFLVGALRPNPYAYYQMMDWVVVGAALLNIYQAYKHKNMIVVWTFILVAVIFNPLAPFYLRSDVWQLADVVVALMFALSLFLVKLEEDSPKKR